MSKEETKGKFAKSPHSRRTAPPHVPMNLTRGYTLPITLGLFLGQDEEDSYQRILSKHSSEVKEHHYCIIPFLICIRFPKLWITLAFYLRYIKLLPYSLKEKKFDVTKVRYYCDSKFVVFVLNIQNFDLSRENSQQWFEIANVRVIMAQDIGISYSWFLMIADFQIYIIFENYYDEVQKGLYVFLYRNLPQGLVLKVPYFWTSFRQILVRTKSSVISTCTYSAIKVVQT